MLLAHDKPLVSVGGIRLSVARQGGLPFIFFRNPGFRFAPPGATCFRPSRQAGRATEKVQKSKRRRTAPSLPPSTWVKKPTFAAPACQ
jgi:hypothetical protein